MEKEKNSASKASREAVWGGERFHRSARYAHQYFSYWTPFFAFSPTAEPGPRLRHWDHLRIRIVLTYPYHYQSSKTNAFQAFSFIMASWEDAWGNQLNEAMSDVKILHMTTIPVLLFLFPRETTSQPSQLYSALQYRSIQPLASPERSENNRQQTFVLSLKQYIIFSRPRLGDMGASTGERNGIHNYSRTLIEYLKILKACWGRGTLILCA